jgi:SH3 domain protein
MLTALTLGAAEPAFVTDKLEVQLRKGPSLQHKIVKMVASGTPLTILQQDPVTGYSRVALDSGVQGWILTRYLTKQPPAIAASGENDKRVAELLEENRLLKEQIRYSKLKPDDAAQLLNEETKRLTTELNAVRQTAANALQIQAERDQLQERVIKLERELDSAKRGQQALKDSQKQDWFLIGAGVLFGGILLGVVLPRISWRKKSSWDSF